MNYKKVVAVMRCMVVLAESPCLLYVYAETEPAVVSLVHIIQV